MREYVKKIAFAISPLGAEMFVRLVNFSSRKTPGILQRLARLPNVNILLSGQRAVKKQISLPHLAFRGQISCGELAAVLSYKLIAGA